MMRRFSSFFILAGLLAASAALAAESNEVSLPDIPPPAPVVEVTAPGEAPHVLGTINANTPLVSPPPPATGGEVTVAGDQLRDVLTYVYEHHPQLMAERERVKSVDEQVALAVSNFRPDLFADYQKGRERRKTGGTDWSYGPSESKGITLTQPIFSGLDGVAGLKAARQRVEAARAELIAVEQQVLFNAVVAYTGVVEAQSVLMLNQNNVDVLGRQRDAASIRFEVGELTRTDVSQAEARLASAKASEQQAVGDLAIARAAFARVVGMPAPEMPVMPDIPASLPKTRDEALSEAARASPVLDAARHREKAFRSDIAVQAGSIIPDVSVQGTMRRSEGGNVFASRIDTDAIMLNVAIPLYQSGAEWSRLRAARNIADQARYNTLDTALAVEQDATGAWENYITAMSVITSTDAAVKASGLALEGVRQENEFGVRTVLDVLDAEQEFMNAKVNYVRAVRTHKIQAYRLLASTGKLTAGELSLPVKIYDPKDNYNGVKYQLLGW